MRILIKPLLVLLLVSVSALAKAADPLFVVYYVKGKTVKKGAENSVLKKGDKLFAVDVVRLPAGSELVLVCQNFIPIQVKERGEHTVKSLLLLCDKKERSTSLAYFKYVWNELNHPHDSPHKDPRNYMKTSGAVSRGYEVVQFLTNTDTIHFSAGDLHIPWNPSSKKITIRIYNDSEDGLLMWEGRLQGGYLPVDSIAARLPGPGEFYWEVSDDSGNKSARNYLKLWPPGEYKRAVEMLVKQIGPLSNKSEKLYLTGFILEEHHFLAEAAIFYNKALNREPDNPVYKKADETFK